MDATEFNLLFKQSIPLVSGMRIEVKAVSAEAVTLSLPSTGNGNDKGTLFAGAIYSALVISGWTLAMQAAEHAGFKHPWVAVVDSRCRYAKALRSDVEVVATFSEPPHLIPGAKNWAKVTATIGDAVTFEGTYAVGERHEPSQS